ncbi:hypothetical protein [Sphingomonas sp.]|uniref:hypothetical protein n=1 Tax=Sphingomonas sp. TaxID=28214 RepID=UPI003CC6A1AF
MTGLIGKTVLGAAMAASALVSATPASAQYYRGYRHHDGIGAGGAAVLGGILGLGVGAAIASSNNNRYYDRDRYYDAPPPPPRRYYYDNYQQPYYHNYYDEYRPRCFVERQWDGYGRPYNVRVCR